MHHTRSCPVALFDLHSVFFILGALSFPQRLGVTSPVSIVSGDGYSVVEVQLTKLILFFYIQFSILRFQLNIPLDIRQ